MTNFALSIILLLATATTGCVSATPVTLAPVSPEEAPKLQAALFGSCHVTGTQAPGGPVKEAKGVHLTFRPDGKMRYRLETPFGTNNHEYDYHLEGRNVVSDGIYKTMRVEEYDDKEVRLFVYDITQTYHCTRERPSA